MYSPFEIMRVGTGDSSSSVSAGAHSANCSSLNHASSSRDPGRRPDILASRNPDPSRTELTGPKRRGRNASQAAPWQPAETRKGLDQWDDKSVPFQGTWFPESRFPGAEHPGPEVDLDVPPQSRVGDRDAPDHVAQPALHVDPGALRAGTCLAVAPAQPQRSRELPRQGVPLLLEAGDRGRVAPFLRVRELDTQVVEPLPVGRLGARVDQRAR